MKHIISIEHVILKVNGSFEEFTSNLEDLLGILKPADLDFLHGNKASLQNMLESLGGEQELILFNIIEHGELLRLEGITGTKAKQYQLGNPHMAARMTALNISSGLYAPLRILVHENAQGKVQIEYDLPSSVFAQFNDPQITAVSKLMDSKLEKLLASAQSA